MVKGIEMKKTLIKEILIKSKLYMQKLQNFIGVRKNQKIWERGFQLGIISNGH